MNSKLLYVMIPMLIAGCQELAGSAAPPAQSTPAPTEVATPSENQLLEGMFKTISDLEKELTGVDKISIAEAAQIIGKVDEWLYDQREDEEARKRINAEVAKLRQRIEKKVKALSDEAIKASLEPAIKPDIKPEKGKSALEKMAEINRLLLLYPTPGSEEQSRALEDLSSHVLRASRRVEDIRGLRYNSWAVNQIQKSLNDYRSHLKMRGVDDWKKLFQTDRDTLIKSAVDSMGPIDPSFLEPAVMDLYDYVFGLTRAAMGGDDEKRIELARGFANPAQKRRTPADF